jgi:V/A-type H+-transporting ATPase subunit D
MELLRLKRRLAMARRGHRLLNDKLEELMRQFMDLIKDIRKIRKAVERSLGESFQRLLFVSSAMSVPYLEEAVGLPSKTTTLKISRRTLMNIALPEMELTAEGNTRCYGFATTSPELDVSLVALDGVLQEMIVLAQKEKWIQLLGEEIVRTRRRVNALEYILIPNLEETINYITMKMSELELANLSRLMRVEEIVRTH